MKERIDHKKTGSIIAKSHMITLLIWNISKSRKCLFSDALSGLSFKADEDVHNAIPLSFL